MRIDGAVVLHNVANAVDAGNHTVSEDGLPGYMGGNWGGDCNADGTITLALAEDATCTITNDDISPTLTVFKTIINDNNGTETDPDAFNLRVDGGLVMHNVANEFDAGPHTVSEDGLAGYTPGPWGGDCNTDGTITLALDQDATCTITNDDIDPTTLTLIKQVVNDDGGGAVASSWTLTATGPSGFSGPGPSVSSGPGFLPGTYDLSEMGPGGYAASDWVCIGGTQDDADTVTLAPSEDASCIITNDDISPTITVFKTIVNDDGGTETDENAFGLMVNGNPVQHNVANEFVPGMYTVSETGLAGYQAGPWGGDCDSDGSINLVLGQQAICTITNDDIPATLTVFKTIINDNGGTVTDQNAFGLRIDGNL
ncbi:MAG: hypothetical protein R3330_17705, partial [Saprospiraceae bacterium]|nr:hypothetical protein [Saprospiraceae bacterium]